ncbi:unnamed protein product [Vicia faba]|uniref:VHS domain-containing protein n=1 Tax=Vicia faba TaxID=3906 RepID=A0AAV1ADT9_VICFA|nr:unnamed protein product [Vicia faba]CAI8608123.1 unnamed protein product [Vicia faba]
MQPVVLQPLSDTGYRYTEYKTSLVLGLLGGGQPNSSAINSDKAVKTELAVVAELPDLIDTGYSNDNTTNITDELSIGNLTSSAPLVDDLFGDVSGSIGTSHELKNDDDPFADVSFHTGERKEQADDLFSGMTVGEDKQGDHESHKQGSQSDPQLFDIFGSSSRQGNHNESVNDLMGGLSINENTSTMKHKGTSSAVPSESLFSGLNNHTPDNTLGGMLGSQPVGFNVNPMFPTGHLPYNMQPGVMLNQPYPSQPLNYGAMGSLLAQQQLLATMANFQHLNNVNMRDDGIAQMVGPNGTTPLPDIFQPNFASQTSNSMINNSKKEDNTKAFDFISDHLASARDSRRVI